MKILWGRVLTSKTVWLGVVMIGAAIFEYIAGLPQGTSIAQTIFGIFTIFVRFWTNDSLISKP